MTRTYLFLSNTFLGSRGALILLLLSQAACVGTAPAVQFYLLEPSPEAQTVTDGTTSSKLSLALLPVRIPHYLERSQLVTATEQNTYRLEEQHRWAESLDENITRVMLQELNAFAPANVVLIRSHQARQAELLLSVNIIEFYSDAQGQAKLHVQWLISRGDDVLVSQTDRYLSMGDKTNMRLNVHALNHCLTQLDQTIATVIRQLQTK